MKIIEEGMKQFKDSKLLSLNMLFYKFEILRLYSPIYFSKADYIKKYGIEMSLSTEFCLFRLEEKMKKYLINRNQKLSVTRKLKIE